MESDIQISKEFTKEGKLFFAVLNQTGAITLKNKDEHEYQYLIVTPLPTCLELAPFSLYNHLIISLYLISVKNLLVIIKLQPPHTLTLFSLCSPVKQKYFFCCCYTFSPLALNRRLHKLNDQVVKHLLLLFISKSLVTLAP